MGILRSLISYGFLQYKFVPQYYCITGSWNCSFYRKLSLSTNCIEKIANLNGLSKSMEVQYCIDLINFKFLLANIKCEAQDNKPTGFLGLFL